MVEVGSNVIPFELHRIRTLMEPEPGDPAESEGVLNPGAARGPDGTLYLFPRLVARGNYSRIGIARVLFDDAGDPIGVERLGIALEPEAPYELRADGGGCEDPRITRVEPIGLYVMTYTALSERGPRIALALSEDLLRWRRLGLATFEPHDGLRFDEVPNKDALVFPVAIPAPDGRPAMALIHRPLYPGTEAPETAQQPMSRAVDLPRESMWIAYCSLAPAGHGDLHHLCHFTMHHRLAAPVAPWERLKIGGGTPPLLTPHGWLMLYHGVSESLMAEPTGRPRGLRYSAGALVLDRQDPRLIRYRSAEPVLSPELAFEHSGVVPDVVFPTAVDRREDLSQPERVDVYYGMADARIGVARLDLPTALPPVACADPPMGRV